MLRRAHAIDLTQLNEPPQEANNKLLLYCSKRYSSSLLLQPAINPLREGGCLQQFYYPRSRATHPHKGGNETGWYKGSTLAALVPLQVIYPDLWLIYRDLTYQQP